MKQSENILSAAAAVILAPILCVPVAILLVGTFFPQNVDDNLPFAEIAGALVLTIISIPFIFIGIRNGIRRTFQ